MGLLFDVDQKDWRMGLSDSCGYQENLFLWNSLFDPGADPAESFLEAGTYDETGSAFQLPVSGTLCKCGSTVHAGASRKNDRSLCDRICADLCGTGDLTEKKSHWGRSLMVFNSVPSALL